MKHHLVLLASVIAVVGSSVAAVNVHRQAVQEQLVQDARQAASEARQQAEKQVAEHQTAQQLQDALARVQKLQAQCQNGAEAYNLLTPVQKDHVVKPDCQL